MGRSPSQNRTIEQLKLRCLLPSSQLQPVIHLRHRYREKLPCFCSVKAAQFNDSLSQMQIKMIDWLGTRYDQVRLLGPTDMGADNLEISVSDLDEVNKVAMDGYDLKNFISTTFQNLGEIPNGFFIASAAQVGIGTLFKVPFLVQMGTAGLTLSTGAAGVKSLMDSAENKAMQSELESILIDDSPLS